VVFLIKLFGIVVTLTVVVLMAAATTLPGPLWAALAGIILFAGLLIILEHLFATLQSRTSPPSDAA
jgi:hypothetical protein